MGWTRMRVCMDARETASRARAPLSWLAAVASLPTFEPMYGSDTNRTRQPPREQRLPAIGLADVEPRGPRGDAPEQRRREAEHQDVNNLVRLQEKYQDILSKKDEQYRQDMKEVLAKKDEQLQEMLAKKDEQHRCRPPS